MTRITISTPFALVKTIWPTKPYSDRLAIPLLPSSLLYNIASGVAEYAGSSMLRWGTNPDLFEEQALLQLLEDATTLQEYQTCAERLDEIQKHNEWKFAAPSCEPEYNPKMIQDHMLALDYARSTSDLSAMQHLIRTTLSRDLGGMNIQRLYKHSWAGTKVLIEDYIASVLETIEKFAESAVEFKLTTSEVQFYQQSLEDALKYFGRSALTLSGGAILGMKHIGVVKTLWEADLLPEIISGASAGSIIAAVIGVSNDEEMRQVIADFPHSDLACFDPPGTGAVGWLKERVVTYCHTKAFFTMKNMERVMKGWLGDITFREAHYKTKRVLNICVSSADSNEPRLLNHITAPDVLIWSAVCASCSVPTVFPSANIYEKDPVTKEVRLWMQHVKQLFIDGSLDQDIPMRKLSEMFNVNFFIVSQVNPHVRMFLDPEEEFVGKQPTWERLRWLSPTSLARATKHAISREIVHRAQQARDLGIDHPSLRWASVLSQKYTGDINILPEIRLEEFTYMMANPTPGYMLQATADGERATWPRIYRIKNCVAIELALIRAIHVLRERVNFGPEARAAREMGRKTGRGRSYSIKGQRPGFLRRRSLSIEHSKRPEGLEFTHLSVPGTPRPSLHLRRNCSMGALTDRLTTSSFAASRNQTPLISPQAGIDHLMMSTIGLEEAIKIPVFEVTASDEMSPRQSANL